MIIDSLAQFCSATSAILNVGNAILGNVIDLNAGTLSPTLRDEGSGQGIWLNIIVTTTFVGAASTTKFELSSDSTADLATSRTIHYATAAIAVATLVAGYVVAQVRIPNGVTYERYLGLWETVATANVTAGAVTSFLSQGISNFTAYPKNFTIS